jgi:hypothetical protein
MDESGSWECQAQSAIKKSKFKNTWRKGQEFNLQGTSPVVFKTTALPIRATLPKLAVGNLIARQRK